MVLVDPSSHHIRFHFRGLPLRKVEGFHFRTRSHPPVMRFSVGDGHRKGNSIGLNAMSATQTTPMQHTQSVTRRTPGVPCTGCVAVHWGCVPYRVPCLECACPCTIGDPHVTRTELATREDDIKKAQLLRICFWRADWRTKPPLVAHEVHEETKYTPHSLASPPSLESLF